MFACGTVTNFKGTDFIAATGDELEDLFSVASTHHARNPRILHVLDGSTIRLTNIFKDVELVVLATRLGESEPGVRDQVIALLKRKRGVTRDIEAFDTECYELLSKTEAALKRFRLTRDASRVSH